MSNQKVTKENAIASVQSSVSSIFSKEDVIFLINSIEDGRAGITQQQVDDCVYSIMNDLEHSKRDIIDYDEIEFDIDYNKTIQVNDVSVNFDYIREVLDRELEGLIELVQEEEPSNEDEFEQEAREIEAIEQDASSKSIDDYISKSFKAYGDSLICTVAKREEGVCTITWNNGSDSTTYTDREVVGYFEDGTWILV